MIHFFVVLITCISIVSPAYLVDSVSLVSTGAGIPSNTTIVFSTAHSSVPTVALSVRRLDGLDLVRFDPIIININASQVTIQLTINPPTTAVVVSSVLFNLVQSSQPNIQLGIVLTVTTNNTWVNFATPRVNPDFYLRRFPLTLGVADINTTFATTTLGFNVQLASLNTVTFSYMVVDREVYYSRHLGVSSSMMFANQMINMKNYAVANSNIHLFIQAASGGGLLETNFQLGSNVGSVSTYLFLDCSSSLISSNVSCGLDIVNPLLTCATSSVYYYGSGLVPANYLPMGCTPCDVSCATCTYNDLDPSTTTKDDCLTCIIGRIMDVTPNPGPMPSRRNRCRCPLDFVPLPSGLCNCVFDCLTFSIQGMLYTEGLQILLTFSHQNIQMDIPLDQNLNVLINGLIIANFTMESDNTTGMYWIYLKSDVPELAGCKISCLVSIQILEKNFIYAASKEKPLTNTEAQIQYLDISLNLSASYAGLAKGTSTFVTFSYLAGAAKYVKVIFELEQLIEYHKYLGINLPNNFLQLLIQQSNFMYLNILGFGNISAYSLLKDRLNSDFDNAGDIKAIYYLNGSSFFNNILDVLVSLCLMFLLNYLVYLFFYIMPWRIPQYISQHLAERKLNTIMDNLQSVAMPVFLCANYQMLYMPALPQHYYEYLLMYLLMAFMLVYPMMVCIHVYNQKDNEELRENFEDMMMDCDLDINFTYVLYIASVYRKIAFTLFLHPMITGLLQSFLLLMTNMSFLIMLIYATYKQYYGSKLKIAIKIFFNVTLLIIEICILFFRRSFEVGEVCKITAVVAMVPLLMDSGIKIFEAVYSLLRIKDQDDRRGYKNKIAQEALERYKASIPEDFRVKVDVGDILAHAVPKHLEGLAPISFEPEQNIVIDSPRAPRAQKQEAESIDNIEVYQFED